MANNGTGNFSTNPNAVAVCTETLGSGFIAVNRGVSGSTTRSWVGSGGLPGTVTAFQNNNVDIISIMLGSNDANGNFQISSGEYKSNLQVIIDTLKAGGIRQVILQNPIYRDITDTGYKQRLIDYQTSITELVAENGGYVLQGGTGAYGYFKTNTNEL
ncbi:hypothetical protein FACS1894176_09330 [Bacteroidia bacterium]|nr:hypothetical protein FACS1894176_09330 [Bacteroidia bacterium]